MIPLTFGEIWENSYGPELYYNESSDFIMAKYKRNNGKNNIKELMVEREKTRKLALIDETIKFALKSNDDYKKLLDKQLKEIKQESNKSFEELKSFEEFLDKQLKEIESV